MFGDIMGNLEQKQAEMQKKMAQFTIEIEVEGVTITGNAARQVTNITISPEAWAAQDKEMLEDLLLEGMNRFIVDATKKEAEESQKMMSEMLPPGFEDMFK